MKMEKLFENQEISAAMYRALRMAGIDTTQKFGNMTLNELATAFNNFYRLHPSVSRLRHEVPHMFNFVKGVKK